MREGGGNRESECDWELPENESLLQEKSLTAAI